MAGFNNVSQGDSVVGEYFGVPFAGVVEKVWYWNHRINGNDSVFVRLDQPIVVNGESRDALSISSRKSGYVQKKEKVSI